MDPRSLGLGAEAGDTCSYWPDSQIPPNTRAQLHFRHSSGWVQNSHNHSMAHGMFVPHEQHHQVTCWSSKYRPLFYVCIIFLI